MVGGEGMDSDKRTDSGEQPADEEEDQYTNARPVVSRDRMEGQ